MVRGWRWWRVSFGTARGAERAGARDGYETRAEPPVGPRIAGLRPRRRWYRPPWRPQRHRGYPVALGPNARPRWGWRATGSFGRSWGPERRVATRAAPEARYGTSGRVVRSARRRRREDLDLSWPRVTFSLFYVFAQRTSHAKKLPALHYTRTHAHPHGRARVNTHAVIAAHFGTESGREVCIPNTIARLVSKNSKCTAPLGV